MKRPLMWLCLLGMIAGFLLHACYLKQHPVPEYAGDVIVYGIIRQKDVRDGREILYLKNVEISFLSNEGDSARNSSFEKLSYGIICTPNEEGGLLSSSHPLRAKVCIRGRLSTIAPATNPGEFDQAGYYRARGYAYRLSDAEVTEQKGGNALLESLYGIRRKATGVLVDSFGEKYGGILGAMLFGEKEFLNRDSKTLYQTGGISHILAISGLHISLIGAFCYAILGLVPMKDKYGALLTILILVLYGFMVGFAASVFRAVFMFGARLVAKQLKRSYDAPTALMASAFMVSLAFPGMLTDASFLLSHVAVGGILLIAPLFAPLANLRKHFGDALQGGSAVFLSTLPILLSNSGTFSFAGLFLNLIVIPAMPVLFVCAFLFLFTANMIPKLAALFAYVVQSILYLMETLCEYADKAKIFMLHVRAPGVWRIAIYTILVVLFSVLAGMIKRRMKLRFYQLMNELVLEDNHPKARERMRILKILHGFFGVTLIMLYAVCLLVLLGTPKRSVITFLDVGQGDGIFIRTPSKTVCMIDGGSTSKNRLGENILIPYLRYEGEVKVDYWFLTHADKDHISGFTEVLEGDEIEIGTIVLPYCQREDFAEIEGKAKEEGAKVLYARSGDRICERNGTYSFTVLSPEPGETYEDRNDSSLVILYETKRMKAAFMGDAGLRAEAAVTDFLNGDNLTILKSAHHGSANNTNSEDFYRMTRPECVVISCGRNNPYGHPHRETLEHIDSVDAILRRTDEEGAISY